MGRGALVVWCVLFGTGMAVLQHVVDREVRAWTSLLGVAVLAWTYWVVAPRFE